MHGPHTILSVGSNPTILTHRHALLTEAGYSVISAAQPAKAMHLLESHNFDLVLVGGHRSSEHASIKKIQDDRNLRVIFLACDQFRPHMDQCTCQDGEVLRKVADAFSSSSSN